MTLLTKNSFLDEIRKQYVQTARAKGVITSYSIHYTKLYDLLELADRRMYEDKMLAA